MDLYPDLYFVKMGRDCGLIAKNESLLMASIKNILAGLFRRINSHYHTYFIWAYRDAQTSPIDIRQLIWALKCNMPNYNPPKSNAKAQINGFEYYLNGRR